MNATQEIEGGVSPVKLGWWIPMRNSKRPRWVLGAIGGQVRYSTGGVRHGVCLVESFHRWVRRTGAQLQEGRCRT